MLQTIQQPLIQAILNPALIKLPHANLDYTPREDHEVDLLAKLLSGYAMGLLRVKRANRGLYVSFIAGLSVIGCYPKGARNIDIANALQFSQPATYQHLLRLIKHGYVIKRGKYYHLTDKGHKVNIDARKEMSLLIKRLTTEIGKRLRRGK